MALDLPANTKKRALGDLKVQAADLSPVDINVTGAGITLTGSPPVTAGNWNYIGNAVAEDGNVIELSRGRANGPSAPSHNFTAADFTGANHIDEVDVHQVYQKAGDLPSAEEFYDEQLAHQATEKHEKIEEDDLDDEKNKDNLGEALLADEVDENDENSRKHSGIARTRLRAKGLPPEEKAKPRDEERGKDEDGPRDEKTEDRPGEDGEGKIEPRNESEAKTAEGCEAQLKDVDSVADAAKLERAGAEGKDLAQGMAETATMARKVGTIGKSLWESSRLLRVGAAVGTLAVGAVSSVVIGTAVFIVGTAVVVAGGVGFLAYKYGGASVQNSLKAAGDWGLEALVPSSARQAFSEGRVWNGIDETFGISAFGDLVKRAGSAIWNDPTAAAQSVIEAGVTTLDVAAITATAAVDPKVRDAALKTLGSVVAEKDVGRNFAQFREAVSDNKSLSQQLAAFGSGNQWTLATANRSPEVKIMAANAPNYVGLKGLPIDADGPKPGSPKSKYQEVTLDAPAPTG